MNPDLVRSAVEQFHLLFLSQLGQKLDKRLYALKGGCNLRFYFGSIRYSEDIDLDVQTIALQTLRNKVNNILDADSFYRILRTKNITLQAYSEPKQTETTQRWKLELRLSNLAMAINTKLEFSRRDQIDDVLFEPIRPEIIQQYHLSPILVSHYPATAAYQQKIRALALRKQTQARDIFDLYILENSGISLKSITHLTKSLVTSAQSHAMSLTYDDFKGQVLAYLSLEYQKQYADRHVWDSIVLQVHQTLEKIEYATY